jgi:SAM-dependent methyltransferase
MLIAHDELAQPGRQEKDAGQAFWDANPCGGRWESYAAFLDWNQQTEPYAFDLIDHHDWQDRLVLEVGCGQGAVLSHLRRRGARVFGLDMSMMSLRHAFDGFAAMGWPDRRFLQSDAERLPFPDYCFDAVVSFGVLHHTPNTAGAIEEVRRVLRPGGMAVVMLYRTGNPKWFASRVARSFAAGLERVRRSNGALANWLRPRHAVNDSRGTALLELFGVPTLKAYSNSEARAMFGRFSGAQITNHQAGFRRLADVAPSLQFAGPLFRFIDRRFERQWGFYQVIEARR